MPYPKAMKSREYLPAKYRDEDAARKHFEKARWPDGPICPHCGGKKSATRLEPRPGSKRPVRRGVWQCNGCRRQFTVTVGTIFQDSRIPLHKWLLAIHLMVSFSNGISAYGLQRELELGSYHTALFMVRRIRWALKQQPIRQEIGWRRKGINVPESLRSALAAEV